MKQVVYSLAIDIITVLKKSTTPMYPTQPVLYSPLYQLANPSPISDARPHPSPRGLSSNAESQDTYIEAHEGALADKLLPKARSVNKARQGPFAHRLRTDAVHLQNSGSIHAHAPIVKFGPFRIRWSKRIVIHLKHRLRVGAFISISTASDKVPSLSDAVSS